MGVIQTEHWIPTAAAPTVNYQVGAGVSPRAFVQITNNTTADLFINDSAIAPNNAIEAKFVVPARATAQYSLGASTLAVRFSGLVIGEQDYVDFVFTDDDSARVIPGVIASSGGSSPVQKTGPGGTSLLTTLSGLNIGQAFFWNSTRFGMRIFGIPSNDIEIRPYSWLTLPLNVPSGSIQFALLPIGSSAYLLSDSFYVAWSDINYTGVFPSGAGLIATPFDPIRNEAVVGDLALATTKQVVVGHAINAGVQHPLYSIPNDSILYIHSLTLGVSQVAPAAQVQAVIQASLGIDGLSPVLTLIQAWLASGVGEQHTTMEGKGLFVQGAPAGAGTPNVLILSSGGGGGGNTVLNANLWGINAPT